MSIDIERDRFHITRVAPSDLYERLNAQAYRPAILDAVHRIKSFTWFPLHQLLPGRLTQGRAPVYGESTYRCLKTRNVQSISVRIEGLSTVAPEFGDKYHNETIQNGTILMNRSGAGSIGRTGVYLGQERLFTNEELFRFEIKQPNDSAYVAAFLSTWWGARVLEQGINGATGQLKITQEYIKVLPILLPHPDAQAYIGNKVRQAETLRTRARELQNSITQQLRQAFQPQAVGRQLRSRTLPGELGHRLDPKYYGPRPQSVRRSLRGISTSIADLQPEVSNGFEHREFISSGRPYITVGDVSSGRLELQNTPMIPWSVTVPEKATINECCVLVVRTGSIGTAIQPLPEDSNAAISSHLIRLLFSSQEIAAAVAAFLSSEEGKLLQLAGSYGAVQPQISQDELVGILIPNAVLEMGGVIFAAKRQFEYATRHASTLTSAAKLIVEALIERKVTEDELIAAHNDPSADRALMRRLTTDGFDEPDSLPLFEDLERLQVLLDEAKTEGASDEV